MAVNVVRSTLSSPRVARWLPWLAGGVLAAGIIVFLVAYFGNTANPPKETFGTANAVTPKVVRQVALERGAREVAGKFILTAVARKNLDQAWRLVTDNIKGGLSFRQWMTGEISVPPLSAPIAQAAITKIIYSHPRDAEINVVVVPKRPNKNKIQNTLYVLDLVKVGQGAKAHWLVDYAQVQAGIPVPAPG
jgi:hypothetical protein